MPRGSRSTVENVLYSYSLPHFFSASDAQLFQGSASAYISDFNKSAHPKPAVPDLSSLLASQQVRLQSVAFSFSVSFIPTPYIPYPNFFSCFPKLQARDPGAPLVSGLLPWSDGLDSHTPEAALRKERQEALMQLGSCLDMELRPRLARPTPPLLPATDNEAVWLMPTEVDHSLVWAGLSDDNGQGWRVAESRMLARVQKPKCTVLTAYIMSFFFFPFPGVWQCAPTRNGSTTFAKDGLRTGSFSGAARGEGQARQARLA